MLRSIRVALVCLGATVALATAQGSLSSPYREQQATAIRGLTATEIEALRAGHGMGLARPAELNGYPGPRHVLDAVAAGHMHVTPEQRSAVQQVFDRMALAAKRLGEQILGEEQALEAAFRAGTISPTVLQEHVSRLTTLWGELRLVHLRAHLETHALLTPHQLQRYNAVRGYTPHGTDQEQHTH